MWIDFDAHHAYCIRFLFGEVVNFAFQLVGLLAVEAPAFAASPGFDHPQAFKEQHATRILFADLDYRSRCLVSRICVLPANMPPELLIAALSFDRLA